MTDAVRDGDQAASTNPQPGGDRPEPLAIKATPLHILTGLAALGGFYLARPVLLPIVLAILLTFVLYRSVGFLSEKLHVPLSVAAAVPLLVILVSAITGTAALSDPALRWVNQAPQQFESIERRLRELMRPVIEMNRSVERVQDAVSAEERPEPQTIIVSDGSFQDAVLAGIRETLVTGFVTLVLLYFVLASGDRLLRKSVAALRTLEQKKLLVEVATIAKRDVSRYLVTITLINIGLGIVIGTAMLLIGAPSPFLWGAIATLFNFIPYLGAATGTVVVGIVALTTFQDIGHTLAMPLVYFAITSLEGGFVTPALLGRRFTLSPVAVVIALLFWGWLWGIPGAFLAVPILTTTKIICDHYPPLARIGTLLER